MKTYVEAKSCKLRDNKVSAKIVVKNNEKTDYYACRDAGFSSIDTKLIYRFNKEKKCLEKSN